MTPEEFKMEELKQQANKRYHDLYIRVGLSGRGRAYDPRLIAWRENLQSEMRKMAREGATIGQIEKYVLGKIRDDEDGSIR